MGRLVALVAALVLAGAAAAGPVPAETLKARLQAAREAYDQSDYIFWRGRGSLENVYRWSLRVLDAQKTLAQNKDDEVAAARAHLERMVDLEKKARKLFEAGVLAEQDLPAARYYRHDAEVMLFQARPAK
jgi:hypothetical protein